MFKEANRIGYLINESGEVILGGDVSQAIVVKLPSINLVVLVRINLLEKLLEVLLHHLLVHLLLALELVSDPSFELSAIKNVVAVVIVLRENALDEISAIGVHFLLFIRSSN